MTGGGAGGRRYWKSRKIQYPQKSRKIRKIRIFYKYK